MHIAAHGLIEYLLPKKKKKIDRIGSIALQ